MLHYAMCHDNPDLYDPEQHQLQVLPKVQNLVKRQQHCKVNLCQKLLFLQLIQNLKTDCY